MVVPKWFKGLYSKSYESHFAKLSIMTQLTLAQFIKEGHWDRHIRRMRILNRKSIIL